MKSKFKQECNNKHWKYRKCRKYQRQPYIFDIFVIHDIFEPVGVVQYDKIKIDFFRCC